jgi:xanthine dehydrogenase YagR molybdenum-binding subunit
MARLEGRAKVTGEARYAGEIPLPELAFGWVVPARIARGRITSIDVDPVLAMPGVLAVLHHGNAPRLADAGDATLLVLQSGRVHHHGQAVALVVAATSEQARAAAEALQTGYIDYEAEPHDVGLHSEHPGLFAPDHVNPAYPTDRAKGDVEQALAAAEVVVDATYSTPAEQNNPMEPHAAAATWSGGQLTVFDSNQGAYSVRESLSALFSLDPGSVHVLSEHVGGGFGAKGTARPHVVLAAMAARVAGRPVRVTLTRQQMFALVGYRTPTIQRLRLGAGHSGRLTALDHLAYSQTSTVFEFAEQTAVVSRMMYATDNLRTRHRLVALDVPTPRWMRAPGEAPGSFALESALDELAEACGVDPIDLRVRNEPAVEPDTGRPFGTRNLVSCFREGARRFGWAGRDPRPGVRRDGRWLLGTGVAAAAYPARTRPSTATVTAEPGGRYTVRIGASDIGTGARTVLTQIAADELHATVADVRVLIGDSDFGQAQLAGGSLGTASWSWAVVSACRALLSRIAAGAAVPDGGLTVMVNTADEVRAVPDAARHAYGAQFAEVAVDTRAGEIRVPRLLGIFAAGRVINPVTARSQLIGGMTMGLSMALFEEAVMDPAFGDYVNHDLAGYHVAANADVVSVEAGWIDEEDHQINPSGVKGLGEIGIVGVAAAIANAVWHATAVRHRDLPISLNRVLRGADWPA